MRPKNEIERIHEQERSAASAYAPLYDAAYETPYLDAERRWFVRELVRFATERDVDLAGGRVLDVGTGTGNLLPHLLRVGVRDLYANDISADMIAVAHAKFPAVTFVEGAIEHGDFQAAFFDAVVGFSVLHHLPDLHSFFAWLERALRPGGICAFLEPNENALLSTRRAARLLWGGLFPLHQGLRLKNTRVLSRRPDMTSARYYSDAHRHLAADEIFRSLPSALQVSVSSHGLVAPFLNSFLVDSALDRSVLSAARVADRLVRRRGSSLFVVGSRSADS